MAAVFATRRGWPPRCSSCRDQVAIAALNGPENIVISGDEAAVRAGARPLRERRRPVQDAGHLARLPFAPHGPDPRTARPGRGIGPLSAPQIDLIANLTGRPADEHDLRRSGLLELAMPARPVRFAESVQALADRGCEMFLEIGPSPSSDRHGDGAACRRTATPGCPRCGRGATTGKRCWTAWPSCTSAGRRSTGRASIATTGRRRRRCPPIPSKGGVIWIRRGRASPRRRARAALHAAAAILHPLLGRRLPLASHEQIFESQIAANRPAMLGDHKIQGRVVMPGAAYLEMALAASAVVHGKPWTSAAPG